MSRLANNTFEGKRVLITGGANGLGRALVKIFVEGRAKVFTVDRDGAALKTLQSEFPGVTSALVDLSDWEATQKTIKSFGHMDHLVNNAGVAIQEPFLEITKDSHGKQVAINNGAVINVSQVVAKGMIESKITGSIVNISSAGDQKVAPGFSAYCSTKAAVKSLTKSMALELGPHNIRVNCVCPGPMKTEMLKNANVETSEKDSQGFPKIPTIIQRIAETSEVADLVAYILSPAANMMTGSAVVIDGGYLLC